MSHELIEFFFFLLLCITIRSGRKTFDIGNPKPLNFYDTPFAREPIRYATLVSAISGGVEFFVGDLVKVSEASLGVIRSIRFEMKLDNYKEAKAYSGIELL